jgi:parvulin-like peptidyl-prolyl isomerase
MRQVVNLQTSEITFEDDAPVIPIVETNEQIVNRLKTELDTIERNEMMPRKTREIQIQLMEFLAVQQGITPEQLALNPAYAGMKQIDAQCVALRAQIRELS